MEPFLMPSNWIWKKDFDAMAQKEPVIMFFRKTFFLPEGFSKNEESVILRISADSKYKLYVNGELAETGPAKGDRSVWYADEVDILSYLQDGKNVIAVEVLRYPQAAQIGNQSTFSSETPGLFVQGNISLKAFDQEDIDLSGNTTWKIRQNTQVKLYAEDPHFAPLWIYENVRGEEGFLGWKNIEYNDEEWENANPYLIIEVNRAISPGILLPRPIPFMAKIKKEFSEAKGITVKANTKQVITLDAGEEMTAFLHLALIGGKNAKIRLLQAECYCLDEKIPPAMVSVKKDRLDSVNGHLEGYTDEYIPAGCGTEEVPELYEPFWFRTFRFIKMEITTEEEPLTIQSFTYTDVHYPLEVKTSVQTSDASLAPIWDMSVRTLTRCMHETYEDCPFYEQLQYAMDTRSQILYTYSISADDRLARNAMDDFRRAQRADGLLNCSYPNNAVNVIPGFSIFYILMVHDHMMYFGDPSLVKHHMSAIENVLKFYESHLNKDHLVGQLGGENLVEPFWSFIDWATEWMPTTGVPTAYKAGPLTMESLYYVMGLQKAAELASYIGRDDLAREYEERANNVIDGIRTSCMGSRNMLTDGPGVEEYSQHCQVFGILTGVLNREEGKAMLERTILERDAYPQCTIAMRYYLFRALEAVGLYEYTDSYWQPWRNMIANNASTCTESEAYGRSECHGWGALALYEIPSRVLGVRPAAPGYEKILVQPNAGYLTSAAGTVITPKGEVTVSWNLDENAELNLSVNGPEGIQIIIEK